MVHRPEISGPTCIRKDAIKPQKTKDLVIKKSHDTQTDTQVYLCRFPVDRE